MKNIGILLDENGELLVRNGTLAVGDVTAQNQKLLLLAAKGEIKEYPMRGVGIYNYLENNNTDALAREIRQEFTKDGMTVQKISINIPKVEIEAYYK